MGFGASLAFIAVGAVIAFATRFRVSGIDLQMIGWILMGVGLVGMLVTFAYTRPRRRGQVTEVIDEEPVYMTRSDDPPPHVQTQRDVVERHDVIEQRDVADPRPVPGRHIGDRLD